MLNRKLKNRTKIRQPNKTALNEDPLNKLYTYFSHTLQSYSQKELQQQEKQVWKRNFQGRANELSLNTDLEFDEQQRSKI